VKPWPVNWLDRALPSPWGVMADDLAAGLYAGLCMTILSRII
jgi:phosphatidylglycerophosphatase A